MAVESVLEDDYILCNVGRATSEMDAEWFGKLQRVDAGTVGHLKMVQ